MRGHAWMTCFVILCAIAGADVAPAQQAAAGCSSAQGPNATQTLRCRNGLIVVAEDGAKFTLHGKSGNVDGVDLQSKALLLDAPKQKGSGRFQVITPQAIAAVRGTRWAVDVQASRTSVFVVNGSVSVRRPSGDRSVTLNAGDGVDADDSGGPLEVKHWSRARVSALLARFGQ